MDCIEMIERENLANILLDVSSAIPLTYLPNMRLAVLSVNFGYVVVCKR